MSTKPTYEELEKEISVLKEIEARYMGIYERSFDCIFMHDLEGNFLDANEATLKLTGYDREDIRSLNFASLLDRDQINTAREAINKLTNNLISDDLNEYKIKTKNGGYKNIEVRGSVILKEDKPNAILGIGKDITERKAREDAITQSLYFFQEVLDSIPNPIFYKNTEGVYLGCNNAYENFLGLSKKEFIGKNAYNISPKELADKYNEMDLILFKEGGVQTYESHVKTMDGQVRDVVFNKAIFSRGDGTPGGLVGVIFDVTDQKRTEKMLNQAQRMEAIGTLAGGIAHDFNNILSAIYGYTELAIDYAPPDSRQYTHLKEVLNSADRARDLVRQILSFARETETDNKPLRIKYPVKECIRLLQSSLPSNIEIQSDIKSDSAVFANPVQLHQVVMNLCTNAAHAMLENGGRLCLVLEDVNLDERLKSKALSVEPGKYVKLAISDTGHGIPNEIIDKIFDPYFSTKGKGEGTGLGLAVVNRILKNLNAFITVDSQIGKGSTFNIYIPVIKVDIKPVEIRVQGHELPKGSEKILFVDDELPIIIIGEESLNSLGYNVTSRTSSIEALELFRSQPENFDLVISDMTMPNMTGDQLSRELKKIRPDIPVILCTGYSRKMTPEDAAKQGIEAFVYKPIVKSQLAKTVREVLGKKKV